MGENSGDTIDTLNSNEIALHDDTLTRKLPSITFEKFLKETNRANISNNDDQNDKINESNNSEGFELNFDGGSNALSKFQNPFDESPNITNESKKNTQFFDDKSEIDNSLLFKTPSKINNLITRSTPNRINNNKISKIKRSTSTNAVNEFRVLKEKQTNIAAFGFNSFDESNIGLVVDIRKPIDDNIEENSMDDSSIRLNLLPSEKRFNNKDEKTIIEATQIDGNIHEEVNKLLKEQSSKYTIDDEDEIYLLKKFNYSSNETEFNKDNIDKKTDLDEHLEGHINNEKNINDNDTSKVEISIKETLDVRDKYSQNKKDEIDSEIQSQPKVLFKSVDSLINSQINSMSNDEEENLFNEEQDNIEKQLKETQVIDNFSQSLVLDDDENNELDNNNDINNDEEDYDEDEIKTGRNILQTFRIEDESQSQNELRTPLQTQLETQNSNQTSIKSQLQIKSSENEPTHDEIEIQGSEANSSFGILDKKQLYLPETLKIDEENEKQSQSIEKQSDINFKLQASSPVNLFPHDNNDNDNNENENNTESEIPNTSAASISKIFIEKSNNNNIENENNQTDTSTPLIRNTATTNDFVKNNEEIDETKDNNNNNNSRIIEKLNDVLREENDNELKRKSNEINNIIRESKNKQYQITDILDFNCIFIIDSSGRIPGRITKMVESDDTIFVNVKIREGDVIIEHSKIYAPICFDIGDPVKYIFDKKNNYIVTGLKKSNNEIDNNKIETIDGFNKLLIKKKLKKDNEQNEEIEVELKDIYLTGVMCRKYKYKLFNDLNDFQKYLDYQIQQFNLNDENNDKYSYELNADDTLINLLPVSRSRSLINNKNKGYFYRCLFILTGINNNKNNKSESKNNTPRHNKEKRDINQLIEFIQSQGGTVLQEAGFEDIIKFKLKDKYNTNKYKKINNINMSNNNSPKRNKINNNNNNNNTNNFFGENGLLNNENNEFINYKCLEDKGEYYNIKFKRGDNDDNNNNGIDDEDENCIEIDEEIGQFEFGCVISSRHVRTLKYLECLCLKWPIIHIEFIRKCFNDFKFLKNWREEWTKFLLISGECSLLNSCCIGLDIFEYYNRWRNGYKLGKQMKLNKLFRGEKIIVINFNFKIFKERIKDTTNHSYRRSKRRKIGNYLEKNENDERNQEEEEEEEKTEEESQEDQEINKKIIDGPNKEETLIWIFRQIGFDEVILIKDNCNLRELLGFNKKKKYINNEKYVYIKYGNDIGRFKRIIETENIGKIDNKVDKIINWEWVVQRIICNYI